MVNPLKEMCAVSSVVKLLKNPAKVVFLLDKYKISKIIPDKAYLKLKYRASMGKKLNLKNPQTYNEKLQWLKLYDRKPEYTTVVDKYSVKEYVAQKIGQEFIIPTLGIWNDADEIDFDALPDEFVLKCTHDCGGLVICKDKSKLNVQEAKKKLSKSLKFEYFYVGREWPYKNVKPRILAEAYMEDADTGELRDYKFYCFGGKPKVMLMATDRQTDGEESKYDFYDMEFNHLDLRRGHINSQKVVEKPKTFENMRKLAELLSAEFPYVRVDLYEVNGKNYFGELTFFPGNGMVPFEPEEWDYTFGNWLQLPEIENA